MVKITVGIDGMACGMCEAHINEAVRNAFPVKKVTSSHTRKETVILCLHVTDDTKILFCTIFYTVTTRLLKYSI